MSRHTDRRERQGERQGERRHRSSRGFSLVEAIVAIAVLSIGVLSLARMVPFATRTDYGARTDSTATFIAMRQMEQMLAQPWDILSFTDAADDAGVTATVNLACTCATPPCTSNPPVGAPFVAGTEIIDYTAGAVNGYRRLYTINQSTAAGTVKVNQGVYDVRWNVRCNLYGVGTAGLWKITVAARPVGTMPGMISIPAHVQAVKMK